ATPAGEPSMEAIRMTKTLLKPLALAVSAALALTACGKQEPASTPATPADAASAAPASSSAATAAAPSVFDINELGQAAEACADFNQFVNAKWIAANPIPADQTVWGSFNLLREKSLSDQHALVDAADKNADSATPGSIEQKIGWLYRSSMNMDARNKAGFEPLKPYLANIDALKSNKDIPAWLNQSFAKGDSAVFRFGARAEYVKYLAKLFELTGTPAKDAANQADLAMKFETELARHSIPRVEMRKPEN